MSDLLWVMVPLIAVAAGVLQTVVGFGSVIFMMLFFPYMMDVLTASALGAAICVGLTVSLAWKMRRYVSRKNCVLPGLAYILSSMLALRLVSNANLDILTLAFGVFLILLAAYFIFFDGKITLKEGGVTAFVCSSVGGVSSALFGIGGPTVALYFMAISKTKEEYTANTQLIFAAAGVLNTLTRMSKGIYTMDMIPLTVVGLIAINIGKVLGLRVLDRIDIPKLRKVVYFFIALSGLLTVVRCIF